MMFDPRMLYYSFLVLALVITAIAVMDSRGPRNR